MLIVGQDTGGFQFDNELVFHEEVGGVTSKWGAVFVIDFEGMLLDDPQTGFAKTMGQSVLVHFFEVAMP